MFWIQANACESVANLKICAGNFDITQYTKDGGQKASGLTAALWISVKGHPEKNQTLRVHRKKKFTIDNKEFEVLKIEKRAIQLKLLKSN